ncbi:T9SS type A sorting domain-containing protein [Christiangramia aquimixticola]|uniref:T9SS type A sorting domain-containing protein n=1 Tax=Christiangramia aquimixticola TaxID=1697558 RepID=UPI003AA88935
MKYALLFFLIFSQGICFAQLHISPSAEGDSYLYVRDRLLFVEKDINLYLNKKEHTQASLYLRKQAQLLQGFNSNIPNKGNGKISVFQKGTTGSYDYNYWGLPVAVSSPNFSLNDYIYEPITNTLSKNAKLISSLDGKASPLAISSNWIYTFSGTGYSNWQYLGKYFDLLPGEGFSMKGVDGVNLNQIEEEIINPGAAQTYDFRGLPNNGKIEISVKKDQILLLGNPYPSAIDLNKFLKDNKATTGIAYFWDSKAATNSHYVSDYVGGYGTYSPGTGQYLPPIFKRTGDGYTTGESGIYIDRKTSPIAQGFMIIGKTDGVVLFDNSHRLYAGNQKEKSVFKSSEDQISLVKMNIEFSNSTKKQLILAFEDSSTMEEDHAMDARKMDYPKTDINWEIALKDYVINVRPKKEKELIPLHLSLEAEADIEFSIAEFLNFTPDRFFIYDASQDLYYGITNGALKLNLPAGDYRERFYVSYIEKLPEEVINQTDKEVPAELKKPARVLLNSIEIFQNNLEHQLEVAVLYESGLSSVGIFDLNGKLVKVENFKAGKKDFIISTYNLSNAVYIVKVRTKDNIEISKKISVKN